METNMPIKSCQENGKPGFKASLTSKCYTYTRGNEASRQRAIAKAQAQLKAIKTRQGM